MQVTPQVAKQWLMGVHPNRKISRARVRHYAKRMSAGEWAIAQPILIDEMGNVFDGQHRLKGVIEHDGPIDFLVIKGFPHEATFGAVDDIKPRALKDWLHIRHEENPEELAPLLRLVFLDQSHLPPQSNTPAGFSPPIALALLEKHPELRDCVKAPGVYGNRLLPRTLSAFLFWKFSLVDPTLANTFFVDLVVCEFEAGDRDPMLKLYSLLRRNREQRETRYGIRYLAAVTIKTWNAVRTGSEVGHLAMKEGERYPKVV